MKAYFISGLGADEKMFRRIQLPAGLEMVQLPWILPLYQETFPAYARRLAAAIDTREPFILVGLSLGGMMSIEINKFLQPAFTILISSVTNKKALPIWFRLAGMTRIYKIVPDYFYHHRNFFTAWLLGAQSTEDKKLLGEVMGSAAPDFVKWAIPRILAWDNIFIPDRIKHLHGTKDVILPYHPDINTQPIADGTHFMVFNRADSINRHLEKMLREAGLLDTETTFVLE